MKNDILNPVSRKKLIEELTDDKLLRKTTKGGNEIFSFRMSEAPNTMYEVARLREVSYRAAGCGTGNMMDIDDYDINPPAYRQLIVWNPREQEVVGGYRYALCSEYLYDIHRLSMAHFFRFSSVFVRDYLPYSIELGRAWVNPEYQPTFGNRKSIFALDNLWDGIGAVIRQNKEIRHLYGKLTIPQDYHWVARVMVQWLLMHYFQDKKNLIFPEKPIALPKMLAIAGVNLRGDNYEYDYGMVSKYIRSIGLSIPPLVSAYSGLAKKLTTFGTTINSELNHSFETGMMICIKDIHPDKYYRYVEQEVSKTRVAV